MTDSNIKVDNKNIIIKFIILLLSLLVVFSILIIKTNGQQFIFKFNSLNYSSFINCQPYHAIKYQSLPKINSIMNIMILIIISTIIVNFILLVIGKFYINNINEKNNKKNGENQKMVNFQCVFGMVSSLCSLQVVSYNFTFMIQKNFCKFQHSETLLIQFILSVILFFLNVFLLGFYVYYVRKFKSLKSSKQIQQSVKQIDYEKMLLDQISKEKQQIQETLLNRYDPQKDKSQQKKISRESSIICKQQQLQIVNNSLIQNKNKNKQYKQKTPQDRIHKKKQQVFFETMKQLQQTGFQQIKDSKTQIIKLNKAYECNEQGQQFKIRIQMKKDLKKKKNIQNSSTSSFVRKQQGLLKNILFNHNQYQKYQRERSKLKLRKQLRKKHEQQYKVSPEQRNRAKCSYNEYILEDRERQFNHRIMLEYIPSQNNASQEINQVQLCLYVPKRKKIIYQNEELIKEQLKDEIIIREKNNSESLKDSFTIAINRQKALFEDEQVKEQQTNKRNKKTLEFIRGKYSL